MSDQEFVIALAAISGTALVVAIFLLSLFGYMRARLKNKQSSDQADSSLTTSELQHLMAEAVADANAPLVERVAALEERMETIDASHQLEPHAGDMLIDALGEGEADVQPVRRSRRRSR